MCIGGQLTLTCSTNSTGIAWTVQHPDMVTGIGDQFITSSGPESLPLNFTVTNFGGFQISRTSLSPLTSELQIDNAAAGLNGTTVDCVVVEGKITTVISVIENGNLHFVLEIIMVSIIIFCTGHVIKFNNIIINMKIN